MDQDQKPVIGPDGKPKTEEVEVTLPCFKAITVFDIEQTTGEPIRTLAPEILTAAVEDFDLSCKQSGKSHQYRYDSMRSKDLQTVIITTWIKRL